MKGAELFIRCLENEDVDYIFGIPGSRLRESGGGARRSG